MMGDEKQVGRHVAQHFPERVLEVLAETPQTFDELCKKREGSACQAQGTRIHGAIEAHLGTRGACGVERADVHVRGGGRVSHGPGVTDDVVADQWRGQEGCC